MARFLFFLWPEDGHVYPALAVARALREGGHHVAFGTAPTYKGVVADLGLDYLELLPALAQESRAAGSHLDRKDAFIRKFITPLPGQVAELRRVTRSWSPDVLVNDPLSYAPAIVGELEGRPVATFNHNVFSWPGEDLGPFGFGLPPARDAPTRARYAEMRERAELYFAGVVVGLNEARAGFGLPPRPGSLPAATISPYLQILPTVPALDYHRRDLPPQVHYVGPCAWEPPAALDAATASWLDGLPRDLPLILVTESTAHLNAPGAARLAEAAVTGLADTGAAILVTLPFDHPLHHGAAEPLVRVEWFVPHAAILPRASAVLTHGGHGIVVKALRHGIPVAVVPYGSEQPEVAQRVVAAGVGVRLGRATLSPVALREAALALLHDGPYRAAAREMAEELGRYAGPTLAAELLSRLAATRRPILRTGSHANGARYDVWSELLVGGRTDGRL